ncbi:uncharacterized protein [Neodiprion pinetum]|uniref:uncharacterized protein n=1 Tax=Neodiprion pinetum TaxID=441929 RepID=UPI001EDEBFAB|nr:uncharacterized protein LOC124217280 [Neodiprion pinetum]
MLLPEWLQEDFAWWKVNITLAVNPVRKFKFQKEIFSDASTTGWGAFCEGNTAHGFWKSSEMNLHINCLELIATFMALKCFARDLSNCELLLRIDNTTAISYVNRRGGVQYPGLNKVSKDIWRWCEKRNIWLFATYIPSKENVEADRSSRIKNIDTEWELADYAFSMIERSFGVPEIDLFASRSNTKCIKFCAWQRDPEAQAIDAFTLNWSQWRFYAFPPFALILRVLRKLIQDEAEGMVVVPYWPTQPWYPLFRSILVNEPIILKPSANLLSSPCRSQLHPLARTLALVVGKLSARPTNEKTLQMQR